MTCAAEQLVEVLRGGCRLIEELADLLASDAVVVEHYGDKLQNLDVALQSFSAVATELMAPGTGPAALSQRLKNLNNVCAQASAFRSDEPQA